MSCLQFREMSPRYFIMSLRRILCLSFWEFWRNFKIKHYQLRTSIISRFPQTLFPLPEICTFPLLIRWLQQKFLLSSKLSSSSRVHQLAILYVCQNTKLLCTVYRIWCCLLCTDHMYWQLTPVILKSSRIGHTIIVLTPCSHIKISIVAGIALSRQFTYGIFPYVLCSPCTWCPQIHFKF